MTMKKHVYSTMKSNGPRNIATLFGITQQALFMLRKRGRFEAFR